jgi:endonuclease-3 related protein
MDDQKLKRILADIYRRLFARYGPQHWWPAREPFEVIVGAILTQSAAWTNVEKAITNLKKAGEMSPSALRRLPEPKLARLIYPCGYYHTKARKLKAFTRWSGERYDDNLEKLFAQDIASLRRQLLDVYGIGEETADSIILYAGNKPVFVIDAYTRRITDRLGLAPRIKSYSAYQKLFMDNLPPDPSLFNEYHALLVRLAKENCKKQPICAPCCLNPRPSVKSDPAADFFPCARLVRK